MLPAGRALSVPRLVDWRVDEISARPELFEFFALLAMVGDDLLVLDIELCRGMPDEEHSSIFNQLWIRRIDL